MFVVGIVVVVANIVACVVIRSAVTTSMAVPATININRYGVAAVDDVAKVAVVVVEVAVAVIVSYVCASRCGSEVSLPVTAR